MTTESKQEAHTPTPFKTKDDLRNFIIMGSPKQKAYVRRAVNFHSRLVSLAETIVSANAEYDDIETLAQGICEDLDKFKGGK